MSRRTRALVLFISTPLVAFVLVGGLLGASRPAPQEGVRHLRVFNDVASYIVSSYVENVNVDKVFDGAMRGLVDGLDGSSGYLKADEVKAIDANTPAGAADVGLVLTRQFYLRVVGVRDGSPAAKAKLETGDFIRAIDGTASRDLSAYEGARMLRGAVGSKVALLVIRGSAADPREIDLTREVPGTDRASGKALPSGDAYVRVSSFAPQTAAAIKSSLASLGSAASSGVIIDLRDTADGTGDDAVAAAKLFVKNGTLATRAGRTDGERTVISAAAGDGELTMPVVLLVSNGTANASEIFAASLSGAKRATMVGEPTAGIAGLQHLVRLPEGNGLWLTYQRYLQADGSPIHEHPLRPDVLVDIPAVAFDEAPPATDAALARAVEELKRLRTASQPATTASAPPRPDDATRPTTVTTN